MKNKKIDRELKIIRIFSIITILLVLVINFLSLYHIKTMHDVTENIYMHPLKVSNAALNVQKGVIKIHRDMKDVVLCKSQSELKNVIQRVDDEEKNVYASLKIIELNILGSKGLALYKKTYILFENWKSIRDEVISLVRTNRLEDAIEITKNKGAIHVSNLESSALKLNRYAHHKADEFQRSAQITFMNFKYINIIFTIIALGIFMIFISYIQSRLKKYMELIAQNQEEYKELYERFQLAIDGSNDGLWDWDIEAETIYFSAKWKEMLGYEDHELLNNFETWKSRVHPDDLTKALKHIELSHLNQSTEYKAVHRLKHKDGSWVWILDRGKTIFDKDGKAIRMIGFHTDITEQKEQELRIKALSLLLNNTLNSFTNLIFVKDKDFKYLECNRAFEILIGMSRENIMGKTDYDLFDKEIADAFRVKDIEMLEEGISKNNYEWVTYPNGDRVYFLTSKSPLYDEHNNIVGLVGNSIDVTREKELESEILEKDEIMIAQSRHAAMGEMISMIAHQWRQPISVIAMDANNILADIELNMINEDELRDSSRDIITQTAELSKTIDDFREFFKPNKSIEKIYLIQVFNDAYNVIGKSLENNSIEIIVNIDKTIEIETFSRELMQVIINIIKNAKEVFSEKNISSKLITINSSFDEESIRIDISDNAGGINEDILVKIFDPYFTTKGAKNGTGLGLYISKIIIEKHLHGTIKAFNKDDGANFEIVLPWSLK